MLGNVSDLITSRDPGISCIHLGKHTDDWHVTKLKEIGQSIQTLQKSVRDYAAAKRELDALVNKKNETYDITPIVDKCMDIQELLNEGLDANDKLNFRGSKIYEGLKNMKHEKAEALSKQLEDKLSELKDKASDASNQLYMKGHLYTLVMNILQEIVRTDSKGKERFAQARPH